MRLSNRIRDEIIGKVLDHSFYDRLKLIEDEKRALYEETYDVLYPKELLDKMSELEPFRYDDKGEYLPGDFYSSSRTFRIAYGYKTDWANIKKAKPFASNRVNRLPIDHPLTEKHDHICNRYDTLITERNTLRHEIRAILYSVSTFKKLYDVWPEVAQFTSDIEIKAEMQLPAVKVDSINKRLGLVQ